MLAGEHFSDEPDCVCPVIAEFLRTYNDQVDNERRQDLFAYAALVVGSRKDHRTEREPDHRFAPQVHDAPSWPPPRQKAPPGNE